jgi:hypothetical protein
MITEGMLSRIENDLHAGPSFVNLFRPFHTEENPMFLLAVVKFKKNPTWDSLLSVYHKHVRGEAQHQANISGPAKVEIEKYVKFWGDSQTGLKDQGVTLHMGPVKGDIFDLAFRDVMGTFDRQLDSIEAQGAVCKKFLADFNITV